jgi:hypothetical protein
MYLTQILIQFFGIQEIAFFGYDITEIKQRPYRRRGISRSSDGTILTIFFQMSTIFILWRWRLMLSTLLLSPLVYIYSRILKVTVKKICILHIFTMPSNK